MDFLSIADSTGNIVNPFAGKTQEGTWLSGVIDAHWLNANFGEYATASEMKVATNSEGLKLFFDYLVERGKLQP